MERYGLSPSRAYDALFDVARTSGRAVENIARELVESRSAEGL